MKIERILFFSFFLLMTISTLLATSTTFWSLKNYLEKQINSNLEKEANYLMENIDMFVFERLNNIHLWAQMSELREGLMDGDEHRASLFLQDIKQGYKGMFSNLVYTDLNLRVVASTSPNLIGKIYPPTSTHYVADFPNGEVLIEDIPDTNLNSASFANILMRVSVYDKDPIVTIGYLFGEFQMEFLNKLLDKASNSETGDRQIMILDGEGKLIAASLDYRTPKYLIKQIFTQWRPIHDKLVFKKNGDPISRSQVIIGNANSEGYLGYAPLGWSVNVIQTREEAYLSIHNLWAFLFFIVILTLTLAFFASHFITKRIAKPLLELTQWVKTHVTFNTQPVPFAGNSNTKEITDLGNAFNQMLNVLESSRDHCIQASKLAVVGEMSAIMAHEVRTPVSIMSSAAQFLQKEKSFNKECEVMTQVILDESNRLNKLITNLLACASPSEPKMQKLNLDELIANVVLLLKTKFESKRHNLAIKLSPSALIIKGDSGLLTQAFLNLLLNAIQMTPENGNIQITSTTQNGQLEVEFADSGPGIHPDELQRVFDPFFTKRDGGVGLGLTVTKQIIKSHQGLISIVDNKWGGASFKLSFPIHTSK